MKDSGQQIIRSTRGYDYLLFRPEEYDEQEKWPLILFLHGAGERGGDPDAVRRHGIPKIVEADPHFPFVVISPQCPDGEAWDSRLLSDLLLEFENDPKIDNDRMSVTGISMGGYGTWQLATEYPARFAAMVPVCGGGDPDRACLLRTVPIWVFHGAKDRIIPLSESEAMVNALRACDGDVRFTVYPDAGHDSWTETYQNPELYRWLLSKKRFVSVFSGKI